MATLELDQQQIDSLDDSEFAKYLTGMLTEKLGLRGYLRFLRLYGPHTGNYTEERREWQDSITIDDFLSASDAHSTQH